MKGNNSIKPKVSIIIACYNDPYVEEAVDSAFAQSYEPKEVILVDDGSDGKVAEVIKNCNDRVDHLLVQSNSGQSIARNNGIKKSSGKYILNHDSDDYFEPEFIAKAVKIMEAEEEVKIVTCKANRIYKNKKIDIFTPAGGDFRNFLYSNSALGSSMFRREDWEKVGGYEEKLPILGFEDWELYLNILKIGGRAEVLDEVLFNYRLRENSTTRNIANLRNEKFRHILLKHQELYSTRFEETIGQLFKRIGNEQKKYNKLKESPDYKTGRLFLKPLRYLKKKFKIGRS